MALSWNEIKDRAIRFSKEWEHDFNEDAEAKSFMDDFFNVFGVPRRRVATFEEHVKKEGGKQGFIDLLWKGTILIEFKSRGKDLDKAHQQAKDYFPGIKDSELPKYILVSDFANFRLYDLDENTIIDFKLADLVHNVQLFGFIIGYQKKVYKEQDPANIKAAELMGKLHDRLEEIGYDGHPLEVYLVRILFCLFAEDTTIFNKQQFQDYIEQRTAEDGSDLAARIQELFQVLNTPADKRFKNLDEQLNEFPYVNGKLFEEVLPTASFDSKMRQALLDCCYIDWSKISPAIFGSMFQSVMNPKERRNLGAHYTSETNILKLIKPLFLDELWAEFESIKSNKNKLAEFHKRISTLKFLDPACGCGNFLVITYRELRLLELEILRATYKSGQGVLDVREIMWLDVDMMYGIEYEEFPARIAEVAMWLIDHQMNMMISNEFGQYFVRLPLKKAAKIVHGNALRVDWNNLDDARQFNIKANVTNIYNINEPTETYDVLNIYSKTVNVNPIHSIQSSKGGKCTFDYIIGNPPFIGHQLRNVEQVSDMNAVFGDAKRAGRLDYVAAWYLKAAQQIQNTKSKVAFVSTNSISQGEQASILWSILFNFYKIKIHFAHRTFNWSNEAKSNAAVHCVIIGFANYDISLKKLFDYDNIKGEAHEILVKNINPYLAEGKDIIIDSRSKPIHLFPEMAKGSQPTDGGYLILDDKEKNELLTKNPKLSIYIRRYLGAYDLLNNNIRYCFWFVDIDPKELKDFIEIRERLEGVKKMRLSSPTPSVKKEANTPYLFTQIRQPKSQYIVVPETSSSNRKYIPISYLSKDFIASNSLQIINDSSLYLFGIIQSKIHDTWARCLCGRLKNDIRYTPNIYHSFPFPENPSEKQVKAIEEKAQAVLDARAQFPSSSLADLYDPLTMPPALVKAHNELDKAVDAAYSKQAFTSEAKRMEFLFELYEKYTADLFTREKKVKK
ncbi:class I SAM-dependent DNA methyltransferase [Flavobacterium sp. RSB2_4_14]|uniref:class I SAM-dependent DNA methyltransferase n=1 Tax=Flavobacterium sp. RSB2_4_14 TaxID=3447665 RepID=UPI003F2F6853